MVRPPVLLVVSATLALLSAPEPARAGPTSTHETSLPATLDLDEALQRALVANPDVRAAEADLATAEARWTGAGIRSPFNPELGLGSGTRSDEDSPVDLEVELWQELEIGGQRRHRLSAAEALVESQRALLEHARARAATEAREAFTRALAGQERARLTDRAIELGERLTDAAQGRFEAGAITVLERNLTRVRLGEARRARLAAARAEAEAIAELGRVIAWPAPQALSVRGELTPGGGDAPALSVLLEQARVTRSDLTALRRAREAAEAELQLARSEGRPNLRFGLAWERDGGEEDLRVGVGIALPLFNRNQGGIREGQASLERAAVELSLAQLQVEQEVVSARRRLTLAAEDLAVFDREVLAGLEENLELLQQSFEAGKISILQLLPLQRELILLREEHVEARTELAVARTRLAFAAGLQISVAAAPDQGNQP